MNKGESKEKPKEKTCVCHELKGDVKEIKDAILGKMDNGVRKPGLITEFVAFREAVIAKLAGQQKQINMIWTVMGIGVVGGIAKMFWL